MANRIEGISIGAWGGKSTRGDDGGGHRNHSGRSQGDTLPKEASAEIDERFLPKAAECIPNDLLAQFASQRLYDWSAANEMCQMPLIHTFESA